MSGLYNVVLGDGLEGDRGALLLAILSNPPVTRYRDAWVESWDGVPVIAIYTRQGGGNRECYCEDYDRDHETVGPECYAKCNEILAEHPDYLRDADDDFDSTYATFYFRVPESTAPEVRAALAEVMVAPVDMSEQWQAAIDAIGRKS